MKKQSLIDKLARYIHKDKRHKNRSIAACKTIAKKLVNKYSEKLVDSIFSEVRTYKNYVVIEVIEAVLDEQEKERGSLN